MRYMPNFTYRRPSCMKRACKSLEIAHRLIFPIAIGTASANTRELIAVTSVHREDKSYQVRIGLLHSFVIVAMCCTLVANGQNLVINPGFENKNHCPNDRGEITLTPTYDLFHTVTDWISACNTSPDYFNRCGGDSTVKIPFLSFDGYHQPRSGDAMAGISMFSGSPGREFEDYWSEYLETRLSSPLQAGHTYYVSYFARLTYHLPQYSHIVAIDKIGARLTEKMLDTFCKGPMFYVNGPADIETPADFFLTDTGKWEQVSGVFHAKGGEQWLTIGAFYREHANLKILYTPPVPATWTCYMLIDDVCVTDMENPVIADTTLYTPQFPVTIGKEVPGAQYLWNTGDSSEQIEVVAPGTYQRQRWSDCAYYIDRFKVADMALESCVWLPNAFTPNNDGENDFFGPGNEYCKPDLHNFSFIIFNRWGQIVFETKTPGEKWDGTFRGVPQEIGVYPYILKYKLSSPFSGPQGQAPVPRPSSGDVTFVKGDVTLIR